MIRYESIITALIGGVLGLVIGVIGALLVAALALSGSGYVQSRSRSARWWCCSSSRRSPA